MPPCLRRYFVKILNPRMKKTTLLAAIIAGSGFWLMSNLYTAQHIPARIDPPYLNSGKSWVDSIMKTLSPDERIAQLFMVAAYSNKDKAHELEISNLVEKKGIGGLIFMQGGPIREAILTNKYQKQAKVPLMISIDGEWGLSMRLDSTQSFPKQMTLGAIRDEKLIYDMGREIARQCRRLGIHVNFAPVADVNNNAANPVINMRSFGELKQNVLNKAQAYMQGLQDGNVLANAKHFPGHGDTDTDSHKALPVITHNRARLDSLELWPFRNLIERGLGSMMVAHLYVPALDSTPGRPSTLSKAIITDLLQKEMGFKGLIFTDALNMQGVAASNAPGKADVRALLAGNDVLLFTQSVTAAMTEIKKAIAEGEITQEEIDRRCRKILHAKHWLGMHKTQKVELKNLHADLNTAEGEMLRRKLTEASLCVLENDRNLLPLKRLDTLRIAAVAIDGKEGNIFQKTLNLYTQVKGFAVSKDELSARQGELLQKLKAYNLVIVSVHNPKNTMSKSAGVNAAVNTFVGAVMKQSKVVLNVLANPYSLEKLSHKPHGLIESFEDNKNSQDLSAQLIFGGIKANGMMPVSAGKYKAGQGLELSEVIRLKFTLPEELGIASRSLARVDSLAKQAINAKATPGCQLLIAKDGKVFYNKAFGFHTYAPVRPVELTDLYDIASITKVAASTISIMRQVDEGFIDVDKTVGDYIPSLNMTNKGQLRLRDILAHQAGLPAWIPFYNATISSPERRNKYYRNSASDSFPYQVADGMYMRFDYPDTILARIAACELSSRKNAEYKYSDLGYYFFKHIIEKRQNMGLDEYAAQTFYRKMGLSRITYNPLKRFGREEIVPTENDKLFRKQLVHGYVHDQGAAMMGGVAGHAGLFANATDLAALMQMILNYGTYGGDRFLSEAVIKEFTRCQFCENDNRRGLGFDKPEMNYGKTGPTCKCVSSLSFGHTGFTGTIAWADPDKKLIYVFLSNRVYPDAENKKINTLATRVEIQEAIYDLL